MRPKAILICFTGIDGSGKTTIAEGLAQSIENSGITCKYIWGGWRGFESFLFKPIVIFLKNSKKAGYKDTSIFAPKKKNILFYFLAWFDYCLRLYPNIRISLHKYDRVILDRYVYDVTVGVSIIDGTRADRLLKKFFYIFPKPDQIFFIDVPVEVAYSRKKDIPSIEYLSTQKAIYLGMLKNDNVEMLDGSKTKEELLDLVLKKISEGQK